MNQSKIRMSCVIKHFLCLFSCFTSCINITTYDHSVFLHFNFLSFSLSDFIISCFGSFVNPYFLFFFGRVKVDFSKPNSFVKLSSALTYHLQSLPSR